MNPHNIVPAAARRRKLKLALSVPTLGLAAVAGFEAGGALLIVPTHAKTVEAFSPASAIDARRSDQDDRLAESPLLRSRLGRLAEGV